MATATPPSTPPPHAASGASPCSSGWPAAAASPRIASAMRTPGSALRIVGLRWPREGDAAACVRLQAHARGLLQRRRRLKVQGGQSVAWAFKDSMTYQIMFDNQRTGGLNRRQLSPPVSAAQHDVVAKPTFIACSMSNSSCMVIGI